MASILAFIQANSVPLLAILAAIVNEVFAANPNLKSNSLIQFILSLVGLVPKSLVGKQ